MFPEVAPQENYEHATKVRLAAQYLNLHAPDESTGGALMPHLWFRLWAEFAHDPKVQMMPEVMQRRLVMLMCDTCDGKGTSQERHKMFAWRISDVELAETKALFIENGFIDEQWNLLNWNKRQFVSDSSTTRTRRYRERKRTSQERHGDGGVTKSDASVTAPDTDTDTDTDTKPPSGVSGVVVMSKLPAEGENLVDLIAIDSPPGLAVELTPETVTVPQRTEIIAAAKREMRKHHLSEAEAMERMFHGVKRQATSGVRLALFGTDFVRYFRDGKYNTDPKIFIGPAKAQAEVRPLTIEEKRKRREGQLA